MTDQELINTLRKASESQDIALKMLLIYAAERIERLYGTLYEDKKSSGWICPKCGTDRTKAACPRGYGAAVDGSCPMIGAAQ